MSRRKIVIALAVLAWLITPGVARAGFFNDGRWYMDDIWWELTGAQWDPENRITLLPESSPPEGDRLEWTTAGWTDGYLGFKGYASRWYFDLNDDFVISVRFHYDHIGSFDTDEGGIGIALYHFPEGEVEPLSWDFRAENYAWSVPEPGNKNVYHSAGYLQGVEGVMSSNWPRTDIDGMLYIRYNAEADELKFKSLEFFGDDWHLIGEAEFYDLKSELGLTQVGVYFGGWCEGAALASGEAYVKDFQVIEGTMRTPGGSGGRLPARPYLP